MRWQSGFEEDVCCCHVTVTAEALLLFHSRNCFLWLWSNFRGKKPKMAALIASLLAVWNSKQSWEPKLKTKEAATTIQEQWNKQHQADMHCCTVPALRQSYSWWSLETVQRMSLPSQPPVDWSGPGRLSTHSFLHLQSQSDQLYWGTLNWHLWSGRQAYGSHHA